MRFNLVPRGIASLVFVFGLAGAAPAAAQDTGALAGVVVGAEAGESLPGANVALAGTTTGTSTDLNGRYILRGLKPGRYDVEFSFVGFQSKTVTGVEVEAGETARLDVSLATESAELDEVVVTAEAARDSEAGLLRQRQKATGVSDAISAEAIGRAGAGDAADAMSKVTGASVIGGKYVNVRGLQGRYVNAQLDGTGLPSTDPDGNSVAFDIFPSNLIENIVTTKTFTPDRSGDFTGGSIDIATRSLPDDFFFNAAVSTSFNSEVGIGEDVLRPVEGLDEIPEAARNGDLPYNPALVRSDEAGARLLDEASRAFAAPFAPVEEAITGNRSAEFSVGNRFTVLGERTLGVIASVSYDRAFSGFSDGTTARYNQTGISSETLNPNAEFTSQRGAEETLFGGLVGLAFQPAPTHEIGARLLYNSDTEKVARLESGRLPRDLTGNQVFQTRALSTTERSVLSGELRGTHRFGAGQRSVRVEWAASLADALRDEPDHRFFSNQYAVRDGGADTSYAISPSIYLSPTRFFRELSEQDASGALSIEVPLGAATVKAGGNIKQRTRSFRERRFEHRSDAGGFSGSPDAYVSDQAGLVDAGEGGYRFGTYVLDRTQPSSNYDGAQDIRAGFAMAEFPIPGVPSLEFIGGVRVEQTDMTVERIDGALSGGFDETDWLPSANLIWALYDDMNLRAGYGRTIARPSFREFAPFVSFNFVSDYLEVGNPDLTRTRVHNVDLRWEWFVRGGELLSVGAFYKAFEDPIERTIDPRAAGSDVQIDYVNKRSARVVGVEMEVRKRLDGVADWLRHVHVGGNLTLIQSEVDRDSLEMVAIRAFDEDPSAARPLQGQSPYLVNLSVGYENPDSGTSINVFFNRFGDRLDTVTRNGLDIYEQARSIVDITASQRLLGGLAWKASVKNLLDADYVVSQAFRGQSFVNDRYGLGRTVSTGFSYTF